jgi:hypothetical protein
MSGLPSTHVQLRFSLWGPEISPELLSATTGVTPSRTFHVGELKGAAVKDRAGWEWNSAWSSDDEQLFDEMLRALAPHTALLRAAVDSGAEAHVALVGEVRGVVVDTKEEALRRNFYVAEDRPFEPFFDCDRPGPFLSEEAIGFLSAIGASFGTHVDVGLDSEI